MHNPSDLINGLFELTGALMTLLSVKTIIRDKMVRGFHWSPIVFFTSWSIFNLFFYPLNNLWYSFAGGSVLAVVNAIWLYFIFKYRKN